MSARDLRAGRAREANAGASFSQGGMWWSLISRDGKHASSHARAVRAWRGDACRWRLDVGAASRKRPRNCCARDDRELPPPSPLCRIGSRVGGRPENYNCATGWRMIIARLAHGCATGWRITARLRRGCRAQNFVVAPPPASRRSGESPEMP
ncbi:hypothetical protein F511_45774 [Dorcoceras hygrometricum]|uniref:Uncharacterized protein n=1 Tax=Dorcoceras hygrometricum TaxID=472368 RepID=A0A2Z7A2S7_9LAMI|nr:hypothetical protein F511_45774 [Dorcoceras hygrometricum]